MKHNTAAVRVNLVIFKTSWAPSEFNAVAYVGSFGLLLATLGSTFVGIFFGGQGLLYYLTITTGFILAIPVWIKNKLYFTNSLTVLSVVSMILLANLYFRDIDYLTSNTIFFEQTIPKTIAIVITIALALQAASFNQQYFRLTAMLVATAHLPLLFYGAFQFGEISAQESVTRLGGEVHTAVWAEIAIGTLLCCILTGKRIMVSIGAAATIAIVVATQMRGAGISVFGVLAAYAYFTYVRSAALFMRLLLPIYFCLIFVYLKFDVASEFISSALMLDDPARGLSSGFSGQFDNWQNGVNIFLEHPLFGVGPNDPVASYTHNGYIKILAEHGALFSIIFYYIVLRGLFLSLKEGRVDVSSTILCFMIFITSAPRYINLQIMPFIGLVGLAVAWQKTLGYRYK